MRPLWKECSTTTAVTSAPAAPATPRRNLTFSRFIGVGPSVAIGIPSGPVPFPAAQEAWEAPPPRGTRRGRQRCYGRGPAAPTAAAGGRRAVGGVRPGEAAAYRARRR